MIANLSKFRLFLSGSRDLTNIFYSLLSYLLTPFVLLFSTPLLLKHLGPVNYGFWVLINSIIIVMAVSNFGLGNAMIKLGTELLAFKDRFSQLFQATLTLTILFALLVNLCAVFAGKFILVNFLTNFDSAQLEHISILIGGTVSLRMIASTIAGSYMAKQRYDLNSKVNIVLNLLSATAFTVVAVVYSNLIAMMYVLFVSSLLLVSINWIWARRLAPELRLELHMEKTMIKKVIRFGFYSGAQAITSTLNSQADKFIVSSLLGPAVLGYYTVCMQIVSKLHEIPVMAGSYLFAKFSSMHEAKDYAAIRKVYYRGMIICALFLLLAGGAAFLLAKDVLAIWISSTFALQHYRFMQWLIVGVSLGALGVIPYYFLNGTGLIRENTIINFLTAIVTLGAMFVLIPLVGLTGVSLGKMAGFPFVIYSCLIIERSRLRSDPSNKEKLKYQKEAI